MIIGDREITTRVIAIIVSVILLVVGTSLLLTQCQKSRSRAAQERVEQSQAEAASNSAADAIGTVSRSGEAAAASEELTRKNEEEIRNAQGADERVGAGVNAAGLRSLCRRPAYRNDQRCKLLNAPPR